MEVSPITQFDGAVQRRSNVASIFPNEAAIVRPVGAILLEQNDEWALCRRYMSLQTMAGLSNHADVGRPALPAAWQSEPPRARIMPVELRHGLGHYRSLCRRRTSC